RDDSDADRTAEQVGNNGPGTAAGALELVEGLALERPSAGALAARTPGALAAELRALKTERERAAHLPACLRVEIARVLGSPVAAVDPSWPLVDLGLDSLKLVQLRQRFQLLFGVELSTNVLFGFPTVEALVPKLLEVAGLGPEAVRRAPGAV